MKLAVYHYGSKTYFNLPDPTLMHKETVLKYAHLKDQDIDDAMLKKIKDDNHFYQIYDSALKKLSRMPYTKKKLKEKLDGPSHIIDQVLFECEKYGYINDAKLCEMYIEDFKNGSGSIKHFKDKMYQKGFSNALIETMIAPLEVDEISRGILEAKKALNTYKKVPYLKIKEKLTHHLIRKGYPYEDLDTILKNVLSDLKVDEHTLLETALKKEKNVSDLQKLIRKYRQKGYRYETIKTVLKGRFDERD